MNEAIKVIEVEQVGDSGIVVIFSDGTRGLYSAALLSAISNVVQNPIPHKDVLPTKD